MSDFQRWSVQNVLMNPTIVHLAFASIVNVILGPVQNLLPLTTPFITLATLSSYFVLDFFFLPHLHHNVFCAQLEYRLEQERRQRSESEKGRRKLEGDGRSTQPSLGEMEKNRSGLEELIKRSERHANRCHGPQSVLKESHFQLAGWKVQSATGEKSAKQSDCIITLLGDLRIIKNSKCKHA